MNMKKVVSALMCGVFALGVSFTTLGAASTAEAAKHQPQWEEPAPPPPHHHKQKHHKPVPAEWR